MQVVVHHIVNQAMRDRLSVGRCELLVQPVLDVVYLCMLFRHLVY